MSLPRRIMVALALYLALHLVGVHAFARSLEVPEGQIKSLKLATAIHTVAVGDTTIAEASMAFDDTILILGREMGHTNMILYDQAGGEILTVQISVLDRFGRQVITVMGGTSRQLVECEPFRCREIGLADEAARPRPERQSDNPRVVRE